MLLFVEVFGLLTEALLSPMEYFLALGVSIILVRGVDGAAGCGEDCGRLLRRYKRWFWGLSSLYLFNIGFNFGLIAFVGGPGSGLFAFSSSLLLSIAVNVYLYRVYRVASSLYNGCPLGCGEFCQWAKKTFAAAVVAIGPFIPWDIYNIIYILAKYFLR